MDAVTDVMIEAMPEDRAWWDYRFPHRLEHPDHHGKTLRLLVETWISPRFEDWVVLVAEVSDAGGRWWAGAYATWDVGYVNRRKFGPGHTSPSGTYVSPPSSPLPTRCLLT